MLGGDFTRISVGASTRLSPVGIGVQDCDSSIVNTSIFAIGYVTSEPSGSRYAAVEMVSVSGDSITAGTPLTFYNEGSYFPSIIRIGALSQTSALVAIRTEYSGGGASQVLLYATSFLGAVITGIGSSVQIPGLNQNVSDVCALTSSRALVALGSGTIYLVGISGTTVTLISSLSTTTGDVRMTRISDTTAAILNNGSGSAWKEAIITNTADVLSVSSSTSVVSSIAGTDHPSLRSAVSSRYMGFVCASGSAYQAVLSTTDGSSFTSSGTPFTYISGTGSAPAGCILSERQAFGVGTSGANGQVDARILNYTSETISGAAPQSIVHTGASGADSNNLSLYQVSNSQILMTGILGEAAPNNTVVQAKILRLS